MGKNKPNRTKNNAKPSSSARSAELLGNQPPTFFGMGFVKDGAVSILPGVPAAADIGDSSIDTNFQLALKKMVKKDSTTKLKALQEFEELCQEAEAAEVKTILPFWCRIYCQLCGDTQHRVREATQHCLRVVISKVKKHLAPYLKEIIGPWFTSQYDTYAPAASAAVAAFQEAFSPSKMAEAVVFCQEEIVSYFFQNITVHTPQTLCNPKINSVEEMEDKYRRVVSSSLLGYASYLQQISPEQMNACVGVNKQILSSPKFWKLGQHKDPIIRHGFYTSLVALCQNAAELLRPESTRLSSVIFNNLSEEDSIVVPVLWDAVLHGLMAVPECRNIRNVEKQMIPKLHQILQCGGKGNAAHVFPKVLPLLSTFPPEIMEDKVAFLSKLLSSMRAGLLEPSVNRSYSESKIVSSSYVECLQYVLMLNREDTDLVEYLAREHLVGTIDVWLTATPPGAHTFRHLTSHIAHLLNSWHRNAPVYETATKIFWSELEHVFLEKIKNTSCNDDLEKILIQQTDFLEVLQNPKSKGSQIGGKKVTFEPSCDDNVAIGPELSLQELHEPLKTFAYSVASHYIKLFTSTRNSKYLEAFVLLGRSFDLKTFFEAIVASSEMFKIIVESLEQNIPKNTLVTLGLQLLLHLKEEEQQNLLELFSSRDDVDLTLLCKGLLSSTLPSVKTWLRKGSFSKIFLSILQKYLKGEVNSNAGDIICGYLSPEQLISDETCGKAVRMLSSVFSEGNADGSRLTILVQSLGRDACISEDFQKLISKLFCTACTTSDSTSLLNLALLKFKCFQTDDAWLSLATRMSEDLTSCEGEYIRVHNMVAHTINVACDVNLMSKCDGEEVTTALPLLKVFLRSSPSLRHCAYTLKRMALMAAEIGGDCSLQYFTLKQKPPLAPAIVIDDNLPGSGTDDRSVLRAFRIGHEDNQPVDVSELDDPYLTGVQVKKYLQWLQTSSELVHLLLSSYPPTSKIADLYLQGRYVVEDKEGCLDLDSDILARSISNEEWDKLNCQAKVRSVYSTDDYPDQNLLVPISNHILSLLEGVAVLNVITQSFPEIQWCTLISSKTPCLMKQVQDTLAKGTPSEFQFLYNACQALVASEASWCALQPSLSCLFFRRFLDSLVKPSPEEVVAIVQEVVNNLSGNPDHVYLLTAAIKYYAHCLSLDHWNIMFVKIEVAMKAVSPNENIAMSAAVSSFFLEAQKCFQNCNERSDDERLLPELVQMWDHIVEKELWLGLFAIWRNLVPAWIPKTPDHSSQTETQVEALDQNKQENIDGSSWVIVRRLCEAVVEGLNLREPETLDFVMDLAEQCSRLLLAPQIAIQIAAFRVLLTLVPEMVRADTEIFQDSVADTPHGEDKALFTRTRDCNWTLKRLSCALRNAQTVVEALLFDLKAGDTCTIQPFTDAFTYTHGFLLIWCVLMEMCGEAHVALRFQYAAYLKHNRHLPALLKALFNLMPANVVHGEPTRETTMLFQDYGSLNLTEAANSSWVEHRACFVYRLCLQRLPAVVREWWSEADHNLGNLVARATSMHVSPILIASELKNVQSDSVAELENVKVAVSPTAREVIGTYIVDESAMQIIISLPVNYPLGAIKVDFKAQTMMPRARRISMFLVHRNGSLRDALALWKSDLDKKFEGVEECEICFSILQGPNFDFPKQSCKTCRKKFHSACLYKWFSTSNKSSCPHCRNQY